MAEIYIIDIDKKISNAMWSELLQIVSYDKRMQALKYKLEIDAKRTVFGESLVRYLICKKNHMINQDILFNVNEYGKPYCKKVEDKFNISHSGRYVVCGWSKNEIGIDVEIINDVYIDIAEKLFSVEEYNSLISKDGQERNHCFYDYWTLKESYVKYKGVGLSYPLNEFQFLLNDNTVTLVSRDNNKLNFYKYNIDREHKLALCTEDSHITNITFITISEILNLIKVS